MDRGHQTLQKDALPTYCSKSHSYVSLSLTLLMRIKLAPICYIICMYYTTFFHGYVAAFFNIFIYSELQQSERGNSQGRLALSLTVGKV